MTPFIPSSSLTNANDRASASLSPDGLQLAFVQGLDDGVSLWVASLADPNSARKLLDTRPRIAQYVWTHDSSELVYIENESGHCSLFAVSVIDGSQRTIGTLSGANGKLEQSSAFCPNSPCPRELLVSLLVGDLVYQSWHIVNIDTGESRQLLSKFQFNQVFCDQGFTPRVATKVLASGNVLLMRITESGWKTFKEVPLADEMTTKAVALDRSGRYFYFVDSGQRDTGALVVYDMDSETTEVLLEDLSADVCKWSQSPVTGKIQLAAADCERRSWSALDEALASDLHFLEESIVGDIEIVSRSADDRVWLLREMPNDATPRWYAYLREQPTLTLLFSERERLRHLPLVPRNPVVISARDGLRMVSYLTLPPGTVCRTNGSPESPLPFILNVHGGPTLRDDWGYGLLHQWLANRGYAVLSVNFRGSAGFGKSFRAAGNRQWGLAMQDDLMDAVQWAVDRGIADAQRLGIMGASYGGYATFAALGLVPERFACGISMVSPMELVSMLQSIPQHWTPFIEQIRMEVGDYRTPADQADLLSRSPITFARQIRRPLLIVQGGQEPPSRLTHSLEVARDLESKGVPVVYLVFPDEGHVFENPQNIAALVAITDCFLARTLGGRSEESLQSVMNHSSACVEVGSNWLYEDLHAHKDIRTDSSTSYRCQR